MECSESFATFTEKLPRWGLHCKIAGIGQLQREIYRNSFPENVSEPSRTALSQNTSGRLLLHRVNKDTTTLSVKLFSRLNPLNGKTSI